MRYRWMQQVLGVVVGSVMALSVQAELVEPADEAVAEAADRAIADELPPEGERGAAARALRMKVRPHYVSLQRSINFDQNGNVNHRNESLQVNLQAHLNADRMPISYRDALVTEAVTSAGETLKAPENRHHSTYSNELRNHGRDDPSFTFNVQLPAPGQTAERLATLSGTVTLEYPEGPLRAIRLSPISDYLNRPFKVIDMDGAIFEISRNDQRGNQQKMIDLTHERSLKPLVQTVNFYTAEGAPIASRESGWGGRNTSISRHFIADVPDDATLVMHLHRSLRQEVQEFIVRDIPLPGPADNNGPRLALRTIDINEAGVGPAAKPDAEGEVKAPELMQIERIGD